MRSWFTQAALGGAAPGSAAVKDSVDYVTWWNVAGQTLAKTNLFLMNFKLACSTCRAIFTWVGKDVPSPIFVLLFKVLGIFILISQFASKICGLLWYYQLTEFSPTKPAEHRGKRCIISSVSRFPVEFQGRRSSLEASHKATQRHNQLLWK